MSDLGYIYFFGDDKADAIKIGFSKDPIARAAVLNNALVVPKEMLNYFPSERSAERVIHERFSKQRIRLEWFYFSDDVHAFMDDVIDCQVRLSECYPDDFPTHKIPLSMEAVKLICDRFGKRWRSQDTEQLIVTMIPPAEAM